MEEPRYIVFFHFMWKKGATLYFSPGCLWPPARSFRELVKWPNSSHCPNLAAFNCPNFQHVWTCLSLPYKIPPTAAPDICNVFKGCMKAKKNLAKSTKDLKSLQLFKLLKRVWTCFAPKYLLLRKTFAAFLKVGNINKRS